jgi:hypothetical protein
MTRSIIIGSGPGTRELPIGVFADGDLARRNGDNFEGVAPATLAAALTLLADAVTVVPDAAYDWNSSALHIALSHALAVVNVSLPVEADITLWPPGTPPRRVSKMNNQAFGFNLLTGPTCTINGAAADANMSPVPDSATSSSNSVLAQSVLVYRETATSFWVWGGQ